MRNRSPFLSISRGSWSIASVVAAVVCALLVSGCALPLVGGSAAAPTTPPSALDPASQVPVRSIFYASLTVEPEGLTKADLVHVIDELGGSGAGAQFGSNLISSLGSSFQNVWSQLQPWIGQRVGIALVGLPPAGQINLQSLLNYLVVVAPTSNPAAAASYLGSSSPINLPGLTSRVAGNFAYIGGDYGVQIASELPASRSLAASAGYRHLMSRVTGEAVATVYMQARAFENLEFRAEASKLPAAQLQAMKRALADEARGDEVLALTTTANRLSLELSASSPTRLAPGELGNVAALPASSWVAMALGTSVDKVSRLLGSGFTRSMSEAAASTAGMPQVSSELRLTEDVVSALGPMSGSVSGTSEKSMRAGLELTPSSQVAGARLLSAIEDLIGKRHTRLKIGQVGGRLVATLGYGSFADLLSPRRALANDPIFRRAMTALPPHSSAQLFVNFRPLRELLTLDHNPKQAGLVRAVSQMRYLIMGQGPNGFRLVLQLR